MCTHEDNGVAQDGGHSGHSGLWRPSLILDINVMVN